MSGAAWDPWPVHRQLLDLIVQRFRFRLERTRRRIGSPRQLVATALAALFLGLYLLNGALILATREPADPERLRWWLSGGMVLYAIYHAVRCAWSSRVDEWTLSPAEQLWLGGAPLQRSSLAVYHLSNRIGATSLKAFLLAVVLWRDVPRGELLFVGVFLALLILELVRLILQRASGGFGPRGRRLVRIAASTVAAAVVARALSHLMVTTPWNAPTWRYLLNAFHSLGKTAESGPVQWLALPWRPAAEVAIARHYGPVTLTLLAAAVGMVSLAVIMLVRVDRWVLRRQSRREQTQLRRWQAAGRDVAGTQHPVCRCGSQADTLLVPPRGSVFVERLEHFLPGLAADALMIATRSSVSVRRYAGTITVSFLGPALVSLSPLVAGGDRNQWFYVVGGIALCTVLLAPAALKIDFRRDLHRMLLLRAAPVRPLAMVLGQIALPVLITVLFQLATLAVAAAAIRPGWGQIALWTGTLSALAAFTFAAENAIFLAYPHHERNEGLVMLIRTKLTFLAKATMIAGALALLLIWASICRQQLPSAMALPALVGGAVAATWTAAAIALALAARCWQRFDIAEDVPPE